MSTPIWSPSLQRVEKARITRFRHAVEIDAGVGLPDYTSLHRWSVDRPGAFWQQVWSYCDLHAERGSGPAILHADRMPGARFFPDASLNFAQNLLRRDDGSAAILFADERGTRRTVSWRELTRSVARLARALESMGIGPGDRVAGYLPNIPETVMAMLAATTLGAVWSSCSPDFGTRGVVDRFGQIQPKVLFASDGYSYNGRAIDLTGRVAEIRSRLRGVEHLIVVPYLNEDPDLSALPGAHRLDALLADSKEEGPPPFRPFPFDHPVYILYSSGTTGVPKCIVHGAGGTMLQHLKEHQLHTDIHPDDRLFYFTTCGWMMWNWLVSGLASEATIVLYEGSPTWPGPSALFDVAAELEISVFGTSPRFLAASEKAGLKPIETHELPALRTILSTGAPLPPSTFDYVYGHIKHDVCLSSISGGTDIIGCFALGNPAAPVFRGELQGPGLGMAVSVFDPSGDPVRRQKGELVCTVPFPSMPVRFWDDPGDERYRAAYFSRFANVWHHGDFAEITGSDGLVIYGRSDAVLNPGGVRIGTAEIYRVVDALDGVLESLAIGQRTGEDERVVLFVRLADGVELDDGLKDRIRTEIRAQASPRHVPAKILAVADIPRTVSGKSAELAVRRVIHGEAVDNADAFANPEALELFRDLDELAPDAP